MNIYKFELGLLKKSILIWGLSIPAFFIFYMSFYPLIVADIAGFDSMFDQFPDEFLAFFGMNRDLPVTSFNGYMALTYGMIQIPLAIQAANYGFHMLSVEERELTADFLLSKPISRSQIFISKFLASLTSLTIVNLSIWFITFLCILLFKGDASVDFGAVIILLTSNIFFQLFFVGIGMFVSTTTKKISSVISYSMGIGIGLYILTSLGNMLSSTVFKLLSPYSHFSPQYVLLEGAYDWSIAWVSFALIFITLFGSYFFYNRRNIASL